MDRNGHARFAAARSGTRITVLLVSPIPEETGNPGRRNLRDTAPDLDPTDEREQEQSQVKPD